MEFQWFTPTNIYFGSQAITEHYQELKLIGEKALIVTGQGGSASQNGSLADVCWALNQCNISWEIFDEVEANPSVSTVSRGAVIARDANADFIIGIGGGSPLDAAKAIAILAVNEITDEQMFAVEFTKALPVVAIPTTAGTGSEVTPYSIITYPAIKNKKSIFSPLITPLIAFVDPNYTRNLPRPITIDTAVDAYSHALEGYLAKRSNPISDLIAREVFKVIGAELKLLAMGQDPRQENREALLYASTLAGLVISHTGTSIPHTLGYPLTYFKGVPHGRANGILMPAYLEFTLKNSDTLRVNEALEWSDFDNIQEFKKIMQKLCGPAPVSTGDEQKFFVEKCYQANSLNNNIVVPSLQDLEFIYKESLKK